MNKLIALAMMSMCVAANAADNTCTVRVPEGTQANVSCIKLNSTQVKKTGVQLGEVIHYQVKKGQSLSEVLGSDGQAKNAATDLNLNIEYGKIPGQKVYIKVPNKFSFVRCPDNTYRRSASQCY